MPKKFPSKSDTAIPAGYYDKRITIQRNIGGLDEVGTTIDEWVDHIATWAHIGSRVAIGVRGAETVQADQVYPTKITIFYIRYRPSVVIDSSMRVLYKTHIYDITTVVVAEEAQTSIELYTLEHLAKGSP